MIVEKPRRASHSYRQALNAPPDRVFPLLCPVRECDWVAGWSPRMVASNSGLAEADCVFTTQDGVREAIWYVTRHEPELHFVEMLKITPGLTACRLRIQLRPAPGGCHAEVSYSHTSLGPEGDDFVAKFTAAHYERFMKGWEAALNHYLETGSKLADEG